MNTTTHVADISNTTAYQDKLLGLLGDRNPIDVIAATPTLLGRLVEDNPTSVLQKRPYPGKWTPVEILGHLCDSEWLFGYRARLILSQDRPRILSMDQEKWVTAQKYQGRDPKELLSDFRALRTVNVRLWRGMNSSDLRRVGLHEDRGEESLGLMLKMEAGHDLSHIDQITRYIAAAKG